MPATKTVTLDVPGAVLTYDVHVPAEPSAARPLFVVGSPMGAAGFATLVSHFADRTVVTYDPPGMDRSTITPGHHPDPLTRGVALHAIGQAVGLGPYDFFGNSGGAVDGLAWVQQFPRDLVRAVLHEPPLAPVLPDGDVVAAAMDDVHVTYESRGFGAAMAKFFVLVSAQGELTPDFLDLPAPDPAQFGLPTADDGVRGDALLGVNMRTMQHWVPAFAAVRAASTQIVPAVGAESGGTMAARAARALAEELDLPVVELPGDHGAFMGGEYGQHGKPEEFAAALHTLLP
ncbi:alpha/beta hydrolase [Xylanimonas allomyrinae]|uniref:Alpha/beta hydrolase n=1 Tax=Xylanimonas allomyrinae TaxID=2509459 RepID=A0A4P6ERE0_9MICO|nr:alpha/beta hydrolase [Xylanimonas allomyrinae]QAY64069.1 alpha/beta hydrolase [Xylanimonas allomyrinae]